MFSKRSRFESEVNAYTAALEAERVRGTALLDLTVSNPTRCGFDFEAYDFAALTSAAALRDYAPTPHGAWATRVAIAQYYATHHGVEVSPDSLTLASGTSEAYRLLFELLCDTGDEVLAPSPGYPLLDLLARSSGVEVVHYALRLCAGLGVERDVVTGQAAQPRVGAANECGVIHDKVLREDSDLAPALRSWRIDLHDLERKISPRTRALVLISPNNPTGHVLHAEELADIAALCVRHELALIVDEVFIDYTKSRSHHPALLASTRDVLTFLLNGVSKSAGLPQLKLSWMLASGPTGRVVEARRRIEFLTDSLLSVSTFAQLAGEAALVQLAQFHTQVRERIACNRKFLAATLHAPEFEVLPSDGGWYQVLRVPDPLAGEAGAIALLRQAGVLVLPGYFFDFDDEHALVISLITPQADFHAGIAGLARFAA